jgi:hypothetical protein
MEDFLKSLLKKIENNSIKIYLLLANVVILVFSVWFFNVGLFPVKNIIDFAIIAIFVLIFSLYRPGWAFLFFISTLALENINIAPSVLGNTVRPYQFLAFFIFLALFLRYLIKKGNLDFPKFFWVDYLFILFSLGGFLSALFSIQKAMSFKQALVALSFVAIYFLIRIYIQTLADLKRIIPFFVSSGIIVVLYAIWQNLMFVKGFKSFEIMPGRPNATFAEADWLGIYLVFLLAAVFSIIYSKSKKKSGLANATYWLLVTLIFIALILTVSRSAWLGAIVVSIVFLKTVLLNGKIKFSSFKWRNFFIMLGGVTFSAILSLAIVFIFHLTNFQLFNRAQSTGSGLQKITIACPSVFSPDVPMLKRGAFIKNLEELEVYNCRHINLEDINDSLSRGYNVSEVYRPDPNINIRADIYQKSIAQIKLHPILASGWGNISLILGQDERGAGLNASNIFLEIWLGSGLIGIASFLIILGYIVIKSIRMYFGGNEEKETIAVFTILGFFAIIVPNLFNSGIFLGFLWLYFGISISLLSDEKKA